MTLLTPEATRPDVTRGSLPAAARERVAALLEHRLADAIDTEVARGIEEPLGFVAAQLQGQ